MSNSETKALEEACPNAVFNTDIRHVETKAQTE